MEPSHPQPVLVHLSGRHRGRTLRPQGDPIRIGEDPGFEVHVSLETPPPGEAARQPYAVLVDDGGAWLLRAGDVVPVFVNGRQVQAVRLESGDVIEVGPEGPVLRFRLRPAGASPYKTVREAFGDCVDCARRPGGGLSAFVAGMGRAWAQEVHPWVRVVSAITVLVLGVLTVQLWRVHRSLEHELGRERERLSRLDLLLRRVEDERLSPEDLEGLETDLRMRLQRAEERVAALENRQHARRRVIEEASPSVVLLLGAYGFRDPSSGKLLRFTGMGPEGPTGVGLDGDGPPVILGSGGSGFIATPEGHLLTNRHVALPWEFDESAQAALAQGLEAVRRRFVAYRPGATDPFDVELVLADAQADLAVLRCDPAKSGGRPLPLADQEPEPGDEVLVLGYPTGLRALLARADAGVLEELRRAGDADIFRVADLLARRGLVSPLATAGVVGQAGATHLVYDAETTHGGSGGPVLDLEGRVVAVNAAVVPGFGGSNLGVPAAQARRVLAAARDVALSPRSPGRETSPVSGAHPPGPSPGSPRSAP